MKTSVLVAQTVSTIALFLVLQVYTKRQHGGVEEVNVAKNTQSFKPRYPAPNFTLSDLTGNAIQLSDYHGSAVLMMFWTTW